MAKTKVSEWSATPANNTDVGGIDINEGCAPSGINNAIRDMMAQIKDMQTGADGDNFAVGGNLAVTGTSAFTGVATFALAPVITAGGGIIPSGGIIMWSGSIASIPSGWFLCNGSNGTPDLRNRFVVGAGSTYGVNATGGSADAIVVSHNHTASSSVSDPGHVHTANAGLSDFDAGPFGGGRAQVVQTLTTNSAVTGISVSTSIASAGSSGTNANLPPYYALAYIMKA
jgi:microcystin-dependent protein